MNVNQVSVKLTHSSRLDDCLAGLQRGSELLVDASTAAALIRSGIAVRVAAEGTV
jgi:hypothetical protein